jgi:cation/acetate symporter
MTYPLAVKAAQDKIVATETANLTKFSAELTAATDPAAQDKAKAAIAKSEKAKAAAETRLKDIGSDRTSIVGLEKPLFELRNPGLISIPLGFLAVILGSLLWRDQRSEDMWDELYVRQNTGMLVAKPAAH